MRNEQKRHKANAALMTILAVVFPLIAALSTQTHLIASSQANTTVNIPIVIEGVEQNGGASNPVMSSDSQFVAFLWESTPYQGANVILVNRNTREAIVITNRKEYIFPPAVRAKMVDIDDNASFVVFSSDYQELPVDTNNNIYIYNRITRRLSLMPAAVNEYLLLGGITANGRYIWYRVSSSGVVYLYDMQNNQTIPAVNNPAIATALADALQYYVTGDGRYVVFDSGEDSLVSGDTNEQSDVFVFDRETNSTKKVSNAANGGATNDRSALSLLNDTKRDTASKDGRYILFSSYATNIVAGDVFDGNDLFVYDQQQQTTVKVTKNTDGFTRGYSATLSGNGQSVVFLTSRQDAVTLKVYIDLVVRDWQSNLSAIVYTAETSKAPRSPEIRLDGKEIIFTTRGENIVPDTDNSNLYIHTREDVLPQPDCDQAALAARFAPVMYFHEDEIYRPIRVDEAFANADLVRYDGEDRKVLKSAPRIPDLLANNTEDTYIDLYGDDDDGMRAAYSILKSRVVEQAYARVVCLPAADPRRPEVQVVIQYWFFYYDQPYLTNHEGDWEMIQIMLGANNIPLFVGYSQHYRGSWRTWANIQREGDHPVIYASQDGHASHFTASSFKYRCWADDTAPNVRYGVIPVVMMPEPGQGSWLDFDGHWGNRSTRLLATGFLLKSDDGPRGPRYRVAAADKRDYCRAGFSSKPSLWNDPITWFSALDADEDSEGNKLGKVNVSVPAPLSISLDELLTIDLANATAAVSDTEYIDNPVTTRRTLILHEPESATTYRVTIATEGDAALPATLADVVIHAPDVQFGRDVVARYRLPVGWGQTSRAVALIHPHSDLTLELDLDGDGVAEQRLLPYILERLRNTVYIPLLNR